MMSYFLLVTLWIPLKRKKDPSHQIFRLENCVPGYWSSIRTQFFFVHWSMKTTTTKLPVFLDAQDLSFFSFLACQMTSSSSVFFFEPSEINEQLSFKIDSLKKLFSF